MGNAPASSQRAVAYPVMIVEAPEIASRDWEARASCSRPSNYTLRGEVRALKRRPVRLMAKARGTFRNLPPGMSLRAQVRLASLCLYWLTNAESIDDFRRPRPEQPPRVDAFMAGLYSTTRPTSRRMKRFSTFGIARCAAEALRHRDQDALGRMLQRPARRLRVSSWTPASR